MVCVGGWFGCVVYTPTRDRRHVRHTLMTAQCERDTRTAMPWLAAFKQCISEVRDLLV